MSAQIGQEVSPVEVVSPKASVAPDIPEQSISGCIDPLNCHP